MPPAISKPAAPGAYQPSNPLGTHPGFIAAMLAGSGVPLDDVDGVAGAYVTDGGGSTAPIWSVDLDGNPYLDYATNGDGIGTEKALHFPGKQPSVDDGVNGVTLFAVMLPGLNTGDTQSMPVSVRENDIGLCLTSGKDVGAYIGGSVVLPAGKPTLNGSDVWAFWATISADCLVTVGAKNLTAGSVVAPASQQEGETPLAVRFYGNSSTAAAINHRLGGSWCLKGRLYLAGYAREVWDGAKISAFYADPFAAVRPAVAFRPSWAAGSNTFFGRGSRP